MRRETLWDFMGDSMFQSHLASKVEYHIVQNHFVRNKPHGHHFEGARCDRNLQKRSCRTSPHPEVECCTVLDYFFRKQQLHHHCGEAPYDAPWQKDWKQVDQISYQSFWLSHGFKQSWAGFKMHWKGPHDSCWLRMCLVFPSGCFWELKKSLSSWFGIRPSSKNISSWGASPQIHV